MESREVIENEIQELVTDKNGREKKMKELQL